MHVLCGCVVVAPHPSETDEENEAQEQAEASTKVCHHSLLNFTIVVPDVMNWVVSFLYLGRLRKVDLIILEGKNVCPSVRTSVRPQKVSSI